jgi:maleylacetoacetate isomerase
MAGEQAGQVLLYSYWRSSSAYRVRIALNLKGISYQQEYVHLVRDGGEQNRPDYREVNPLGLVPALVHGGQTIVQSMAIIEYLEEVFPERPLLPADVVERARVRSIAQSICSEIQPLNNLAVMQYLKHRMQQPDEAVRAWYSHWIDRGFAAVETWLSSSGSGDFCHGGSPGLADCYLVPQVYNAERFSCDLGLYPNIQRITARCREEDAFMRAAPENQADAA